MDEQTAGALLEAAPVGLMVVDAIGTITWASPSVYDLTGYGYEDVVGTNILDYVHQDAVSRVVESVAYVQSYTDAVMGPLSMGFVHADGELRVFEVYAVNRLEHPLIEGLVVAVRDQTFQYRINNAFQEYTDGGDLDAAFRVACTALLGLPVRGRSAVVDATTGRPLASVGLPAEVFGPAPVDEPLRPWQVAAAGSAAFPEDLEGFDHELRAALASEGLATMWAAPIAEPATTNAVVVDGAEARGEVRACLVIGRVESGPASVNERLTVAHAVRSLALMVEREELVGAIDRAARTDALTGLANRAHLFRTRRTGDGTTGRRGDGPLAVLYADLDGFKPVNDEHGHAAGDAVLVEVAARLRGVCRDGDELGRVGGDEFVVLCWDVMEAAEAVTVAERILEALARPISVPSGGDGKADVTVRASIGIALSSGVSTEGGAEAAGTESLDAALGRADAALYEAKRAGKNRWTLAADS